MSNSEKFNVDEVVRIDTSATASQNEIVQEFRFLFLCSLLFCAENELSCVTVAQSGRRRQRCC